jgi:excisionase family DNA binding protein
MAILLIFGVAYVADRNRVLTVREAALEVGLSQSTIRQHIRNGKLHAEKVQGRYQIRGKDLRRYKKRNKYQLAIRP